MISLISRLLGPPFISFIIYLPPLCTYTHSAGSSSLRAGKQGPAGKHFLPVSFESNVPFLSPYDGFFFFQRDSGASLITVFSIGVDRFYLDVSPSPKADSSFIKNNHPNGGPVRGADRRRICSRSYGFCTLQIKLSAVDRERRSRLKATAAPARLSGKEKKNSLDFKRLFYSSHVHPAAFMGRVHALSTRSISNPRNQKERLHIASSLWKGCSGDKTWKLPSKKVNYETVTKQREMAFYRREFPGDSVCQA